MSRPLPIVRAGGWYHVVNHGAGQSVPFPTSQEREAFVAGLGGMAYGFAVEIHAYCAMGTHYHLLARGTEPELRQAIARLEVGLRLHYARARLRRLAVGRHLLQVTRYIHRNPVDAGLVSRPEEWPWSSYRGYLDSLEGPPWLRSKVVLGWLGCFGPRQRYRRFCEEARGRMWPR